MISRGDIALIVLLLILAAASPFLFPAPAPATAVEIRTQTKTYRVGIGEERTLTVAGRHGPTVVRISSGRVRIVRSTCPDNARHHYEGWASRSGQSLVCIPNEVVVTVGGGDYDSVVR